MRVIGLDIHRGFAEAVAWDDGKLKRLGRVDMRRHLLEAFARRLAKEDVVVVEATGAAASVAAAIAPHVKRIAVANPKQVRIIAYPKIKTDAIDAGVLAQLYASGFLPEVWVPDEPTQTLRRQVTRRNQIVRQRSRLKTIIQSILHSHLIPSCPHADLCGASGRAWLFNQVLPEDEQMAVERHLREFDRLADDLKVIERDLARSALADEGAQRLMTIPGVDMVVALAIMAAIGAATRFDRPRSSSAISASTQACGSRTGPAYHGRITKQGRGHARGMLVEAASRGGARAGSAARVLPRACEPGAANMSPPSRGPEARGDHLASAQQTRKLRLEQARVARQEAARSGAEGGTQGRARAKRRRPRLQHQEPSRSGAPMGRASRDGLRPVRRRLESARAEAGAHGRRNRGATMKAARQGSRLAPCSSPRGRPCAKGEQLGSSKKALVDHISGLRALGLGARMVDVLDRQIKLVFVAVVGSAIFCSSVGERAQQGNVVLLLRTGSPGC
jgi:transposase